MNRAERVAIIAEAVAKKFTCFGGGRDSEWNPIAHAMKDRPLAFAAMVPVADVVNFVLGAVAGNLASRVLDAVAAHAPAIAKGDHKSCEAMLEKIAAAFREVA